MPLIAIPQTFAHLRPTPGIGSVVAAWYASWHAEDFPLSDVSWQKFDTLIYSFVTTTSNAGSLDGSDAPLLSEFVQVAHEHGVAAHVAIGGWTGSRWFSSNVASAQNRTAFVQTVSDLAMRHNLDGINFDWEYPNNQGIGCNMVNDNDTHNFLSFLQELRANPVGSKLTLSAATSVTPFRDALGNPSTNVTDFAGVLDYITIMNYDVWGSSSPYVGPNAPLDDACASPANRNGSAVAAVEAWNAAGMPANQIVLGVASYGHSFSVSPSDAFVHDLNTELAAYPRFNSSNQPLGDSWDDTGSIDICGVYEGPGGIWDFWGLVKSGFLTADGSPALGIHHRYDSCSQTPYFYNRSSEIMVSFDNAESFAAKGKFIKENGLRGLAMWEAGGDFHDILLDSIKSAAGFDTIYTPTSYSTPITHLLPGSSGIGDAVVPSKSIV